VRKCILSARLGNWEISWCTLRRVRRMVSIQHLE
jgi:hypothetical protein